MNNLGIYTIFGPMYRILLTASQKLKNIGNLVNDIKFVSSLCNFSIITRKTIGIPFS